MAPSATDAVPVHVCTGTLVANGEGRIGSTMPMPTFAGRPSTMNSFFPVDIPQNPMVGQQRQQISELHFDKFTHTFNVFMLEDRIQNPSKFLFRFSLKGKVMDQGSGDGRVGGRSKVIALNSGLHSFPEF